MKRISRLRFVPRTLTYFKGEMELEKNVTCTGLMYGRTMLINNLEEFQHRNDTSQSYQVKICETDGLYGCEIGNWVSLRRHSDLVFFIPSFSLIENAIHFPVDFFPPSFMIKTGVIAFNHSTFNQISQYTPELPKCNEIVELSAEELLKVHDFEMFVKMFGKPYPTEEELSTDVDYTILNDDSTAIKNEKLALLDCKSFRLVEIEKDDQVIEMFITDDKTKRFNIAVLSGKNIHIQIGNLKVVRN